MNWKKIFLGKGGLQMSVKKWLTGLVVLLATIMVVATSGPLSVLAESSLVTQPIELL